MRSNATGGKKTGQASGPDPSAQLDRAFQLHSAGKLDRAERAYRRILKRSPRLSPAWHLLGRLRFTQSDRAEALRCLEQAVALAPDYVEAWNDLGNMLLETGELDRARSAFREVLNRRPGDSVALNNLGIVEKHGAHYPEALACFDECLENHPRYVSAWLNKGLTARLMEDLATATTCFEQALAIEPDNLDVLCELALTHRFARDYEASVAEYRQVLQRDPDRFEAYKHLGLALYALDRIDEAAGVFSAWRDRDPANPFARHMAIACAGTATPEGSSPEFVKTLYDEFSAFFDKNLSQLGYHIPRQIEEAARRQRKRLRRDLAILDAGCGTGACGPLLRPCAEALVGVDLSSGMLSRARALDIYDQLEEDDLVAHLNRHPERYDLVVAADTMIHFGDLRAAFDAACGALRPGGRLVLTVERAEDTETYRLLPHGRYAHSGAYLRSALESAGLHVDSLDPILLRLEKGLPVHGWCAEASRV